MLNTAEVVGYLKRPAILDGRADVYGLYVQGSSMHPRFKDGDVLYAERKRLPAIGEDAVIYLRTPDEHDGERTSAVLVKTVVRKSASYIELEQYNPHKVFRITSDRIERIDRVIPWPELVM
jgi:phage repressor protein C with HTH and peptisase S24 domain